MGGMGGMGGRGGGHPMEAMFQNLMAGQMGQGMGGARVFSTSMGPGAHFSFVNLGGGG